MATFLGTTALRREERDTTARWRGPGLARWAALAVLIPLVGGCDRFGREEPKKKEILPKGADPSRRRGESAGNDSRLYHETRPYMGTLFRITVALRGDAETEVGRKALNRSRRNAREAARAAFAEVARVERLFSTYLPDSEISRINAAAEKKPTKPVKVSQEVFNLLHRSVLLHRRSGGAFDITCGALATLWTPRGKKPRVPSRAELRAALARVGIEHLKLDYDENTARLAQPGMSIGLGAIAKGYAVDQVVRVLRARKLSDFIVDGGGDLFVAGKHPERSWRVGIKDPRKPSEYFASFAVSDKAVVTSGDYERYFVVGGKRYSHVLDPRTGRPAEGLMSATVVAPEATLADALSTAAFVLGPRKGYTFVTKFADTECLLVSDAGKVRLSPGLRDKVKMRPVTPGK